MYLDFILDIANVGDRIKITCQGEIFDGIIEKITSSMIAVRLSDGSLLIKKDQEISDIVINPNEDKSNKTCLDSDIVPESAYVESKQDDALSIKELIASKSTKVNRPETEIRSNVNEITIGLYNPAWDSIDKNALLQIISDIKNNLNVKDRSTIISSNACVTEVIRRTIRVSAENRPKFSVNLSTIMETALMNSINNFSIGDTLPIVIYYHEKDPEGGRNVFLTLLPNTIGDYVNLLNDAVEENHYIQAKSLCYFLLSQISIQTTRRSLLALTRMFKPVNAFVKKHVERVNTPVKITKGYRTIEKELNELIKNGKPQDAIERINQVLETENVDNKYKSSLLLKKAQVYSSITDYTNSKLAYQDLISFKENTDGDPNNLSHLYTELARLQAMNKDDYDVAQESAEKALEYNPSNKYASTLLAQIKIGSITEKTVSSVSVLKEEETEEDKELILDSDDSNLVISKMIDIDIKEHKYSNDLIMANGGLPSISIAESIFLEATQQKGIDMGERYPIYLEAAKAYSDLPVGSYDLSNYMKAVAFYAVYKGNFLFTKFKNDINSTSSIDVAFLKRLRDSACSYYIESLNVLTKTKANILNIILSNYIKLNVAIINLENKKEIELSGNFTKVFLSCVNSNNLKIKEVAWNTIIIVGAASSNAWNRLWNYSPAWRKVFHETLKDESKRSNVYGIINKQNRSTLDTTLSLPRFFRQSITHRQERISLLSDVLTKIIKVDLNIHLLSPLQYCWNEINQFVDIFSETEIESKNIVDEILLILRPYPNRNQSERMTILINVQRIIDGHLQFINNNTTFYGRTFFFPLLKKWKKIIAVLLEKKVAETHPQLVVFADPAYIVENDGTKVVNLLVKNIGESTAEGCIMIPEVIDMASGKKIKGKNSYNHEIPAGCNLEVPMKLPPKMNESTSIKLSMSIVALYQGKELEPQNFGFTLQTEPVSSLSYEEIPWKDGSIPAEQMFKGRKKIIDTLLKHYTSIERDKPYILYGLTRTGKSSILKYLGEAIDKKSIVADGLKYTIATFDWDLSQASNFGNAHDMWEYLLYDQFNEYLYAYIGSEGCKELNMPEKPRAKDFNRALIFLHNKGIYPIFLVDEFSYIKVLMDNNIVNPAFLHTLRQFSLYGLAGFIYAGTYDIKALLKDPKYGITGQLVNAVEEQINEIDSDSAEELMNVLGNKLQFTKEAISHIHRLSGDVPYFVQMICKYCGLYAVEKKRTIIGYPELEMIVQVLTGETEKNVASLVKTLPENVFQNNMFSPADPIEVHVLVSSISYINRNNKENPRGVGIAELQELWAKKNILDYRPKLADAIEILCQKKVLSQEEDEGFSVYKISVDLFRRWWAVHNPDIDLQLDKIV